MAPKAPQRSLWIYGGILVRNKKMRLISKILCILLLLPSTGIALSPLDRPVDELIQESVAVVSAKIISIDGRCAPDICSTAFGMLVVSTEKSNLRPGQEVTICSYAQLELGKEYILFLNTAQPDIRGEIVCEYSVWHDGAFFRAGHRVYRYASPGSSILVEQDGRLYRTNTVLVPDFDERMSAKQDRGGKK